MCSVANIQDYFLMNYDTQQIVDAINSTGKMSADKIEGMQQSINGLAVSVHELAMSNTQLSKEVVEVKSDVKTLDSRIDNIEPAAQTMKQITDIFLKWIIPLMLASSFGGAVFYAVSKLNLTP